MLHSDEGMVPPRLLSKTKKTRNWVNEPINEGMELWNKFVLRSKDVSDVIVQSVEGRAPDSRFPHTEMKDRSESEPTQEEREVVRMSRSRKYIVWDLCMYFEVVRSVPRVSRKFQTVKSPMK